MTHVRWIAISIAGAALCVAAPPVATQETFAAWIEGIGGSFQKNSAGRITEVDLLATWVTDDDLARIGALPDLRKIDLSHTRISDLGLAHLRPLKKVVSLNCSSCSYITDGGVASLKDWVNLEYLNVRGSEVTSRVFEHLARMKNLRTLDVGFSRVNDDGFEALASLEHLEELHIGGDKMTGLALPSLRLLQSLKRLDVNGSQRTDSGRWGLMLTDVNVESIGALTELESLNIGGAIVSDVGMKALGNMASLKFLDLSRMEITAQGLEPVTRMTNLRRLNLWQCARIDDKAAQHLLKMNSLEILDLGDTAVTDRLLDDLAGMKSLKLLLVEGTRITPARVEQFRKARPDCRIVWAPKYKEVKSEEDTRLIG
jgi:Leucine-rich repeat (LRR) protein